MKNHIWTYNLITLLLGIAFVFLMNGCATESNDSAAYENYKSSPQMEETTESAAEEAENKNDDLVSDGLSDMQAPATTESTVSAEQDQLVNGNEVESSKNALEQQVILTDTTRTLNNKDQLIQYTELDRTGENPATAKIKLANAPSLVKPSLNRRELKAYKNRAEQIVNDFIDYWNIAENPDYDMELRQHTTQLILSQLQSESSLLTGTLCQQSSVGIPADQFTSNLLQNSVTAYSASFGSNLEWNNNLNSVNETQFKGSLRTTYKQSNQVKKIQFDIILSKRLKKIGTGHALIWQIKIESIREIP